MGSVLIEPEERVFFVASATLGSFGLPWLNFGVVATGIRVDGRRCRLDVDLVEGPGRMISAWRDRLHTNGMFQLRFAPQAELVVAGPCVMHAGVWDAGVSFLSLHKVTLECADLYWRSVHF